VVGAAGTGKTYTLASFIKQSLDDKEIFVASPTHKGKSIVKRAVENILKEEEKRVRFCTVTSLLGLTSKYSVDGTLRFVKKWREYPCFIANILLDPLAHKEILIIVDEASMLPEEHHSLLTSLVKKNNYIKVVYVGDTNQLPPVNEEESPVFKDRPWDTMFRLEGIMRSNDDEILRAYKQFSDYVEDGKFNGKLHLSKAVRVFRSQGSFQNHIDEIFKKHGSSKVLCYTRKRVAYYNDVVRNILFGNKTKKRFMVGEKLIVNDFYSVNNGECFYTGDELIVTHCEEKDYTSEYFNKTFKCHFIHVNGVVFRVICERDMRKFNSAIKKVRKRLVYKRTSEEEWSEYTKNMYKCNAPLSYAYALTIHQAQGSTFNHVFIDVDDCKRFCDFDTFRKLVYTGVTRARESIFLKMKSNYFLL